MEASLQTIGDVRNKKQVFIPHETLDHPFDVTLVVHDGKEFQAHRRVLSEASPFFEKLLKSDMKESDERIVRLEMLTELCLRDILEFIYTGSVQISTEDNAQELIAMADYLVLPHLKTVAGRVLELKLNASNAMSTYYFAQRYRCEELISSTRKFILANFTKVAKTKEFLNLPNKEVKIWISSDEIGVSAEEDVFKIILTWIKCEKNERKKYFAELFREVRLVYVTRDYLHGDIVTNRLVKDNESCMDLVKNAMKLIDSENYQHLSVKPRKSLETAVIALFVHDSRQEEEILCYDPSKDTWSRFPDMAPPFFEKVASCHGKLYFVSQTDGKMFSHDSYSNCWTSLPLEEKRRMLNVFVSNDDEIYALVSESQMFCADCASLRSSGVKPPCGKRHLCFITVYKPETNSWEDISSIDLGLRTGICIVTKDNFINFLGGYAGNGEECYLRDANRFDLSTKTWHRIADLQEPRHNACGAAAYGKVFIAGGVINQYSPISCEVYNESTNEWQLIASIGVTICDYRPSRLPLCGMVCVDGNLYVLNQFVSGGTHQEIECYQYDADKNEWNEKTRMAKQSYVMSGVGIKDVICSMRVFKGCKFLQQALIRDISSSLSQAGNRGQSMSSGKRKCTIM